MDPYRHLRKYAPLFAIWVEQDPGIPLAVQETLRELFPPPEVVLAPRGMVTELPPEWEVGVPTRPDNRRYPQSEEMEVESERGPRDTIPEETRNTGKGIAEKVTLPPCPEAIPISRGSASMDSVGRRSSPTGPSRGPGEVSDLLPETTVGTSGNVHPGCGPPPESSYEIVSVPEEEPVLECGDIRWELLRETQESSTQTETVPEVTGAPVRVETLEAATQTESTSEYRKSPASPTPIQRRENPQPTPKTDYDFVAGKGEGPRNPVLPEDELLALEAEARRIRHRVRDRETRRNRLRPQLSPEQRAELQRRAEQQERGIHFHRSWCHRRSASAEPLRDRYGCCNVRRTWWEDFLEGRTHPISAASTDTAETPTPRLRRPRTDDIGTRVVLSQPQPEAIHRVEPQPRGNRQKGRSALETLEPRQPSDRSRKRVGDWIEGERTMAKPKRRVPPTEDQAENRPNEDDKSTLITPRPNDSTTVAVAPRWAAPPRSRHRRTNRKSVCWNCGSPGHNVKTCPMPQRDDFCSGCGRRNVALETCTHCRGRRPKSHEPREGTRAGAIAGKMSLL